MHVTFLEMKQATADNDKQRFSLIPITEAPRDDTSSAAKQEVEGGTSADFDQDDPANFLIRANQGHSIKVDDDGLLLPINLDDPSSLPEVVVHGTVYSAWHRILQSGGLKPMSRNHIHFASGLPSGFEPLKDKDEATDAAAVAVNGDESAAPRAKKDPVISGMRHTSTILIYIDLPAALTAGLKFGRSENGVILSEGNEDGLVPLKFFRRVEERKGGYGILVKDGEVIKELPKHISSDAGRGRGK